MMVIDNLCIKIILNYEYYRYIYRREYAIKRPTLLQNNTKITKLYMSFLLFVLFLSFVVLIYSFKAENVIKLIRIDLAIYFVSLFRVRMCSCTER